MVPAMHHVSPPHSPERRLLAPPYHGIAAPRAVPGMCRPLVQGPVTAWAAPAPQAGVYAQAPPHQQRLPHSPSRRGKVVAYVTTHSPTRQHRTLSPLTKSAAAVFASGLHQSALGTAAGLAAGGGSSSSRTATPPPVPAAAAATTAPPATAAPEGPPSLMAPSTAAPSTAASSVAAPAAACQARKLPVAHVAPLPSSPLAPPQRGDTSLSPLRDSRVRKVVNAPNVTSPEQSVGSRAVRASVSSDLDAASATSPRAQNTSHSLYSDSASLRESSASVLGEALMGSHCASDAAGPVQGSSAGPSGDWALLSDSEMIELAERVLHGMIVPALLRRLSRREIVSLLMARHEMGGGAACSTQGPSSCVEPKVKARTCFREALGSTSPGRGTGAAAPAQPLVQPSPWRDDPANWGDLRIVPPTMPELPNPWDGSHFVTARYLTAPGEREFLADSQAELRARSTKADGGSGDGTETQVRGQHEEQTAEDAAKVQFSERAQRLMRNEDTLKQLAQGAQRLLEKAKMEGAEKWEDSSLRDHYGLSRDWHAPCGRVSNAACPAEDTEEGTCDQAESTCRGRSLRRHDHPATAMP